MINLLSKIWYGTGQWGAIIDSDSVTKTINALLKEYQTAICKQEPHRI